MFNGRYLKYVLSQSSSNIQQSWCVLPWGWAKALVESKWKQERGSSGMIWVVFREVSHWVDLHWWHCPVLLIKLPVVSLIDTGVGAMENKWSGSRLNISRLTCMWPWAGHLGSRPGEGEERHQFVPLWTHMNVGLRTMGCYCSEGGHMDCQWPIKQVKELSGLLTLIMALSVVIIASH